MENPTPDRLSKLARYVAPREFTGATCPCGSLANYYACDCKQLSGIGPSTYMGVKVPHVLRPNWFDNRPEISWWKSGVRSALGKESR